MKFIVLASVFQFTYNICLHDNRYKSVVNEDYQTGIDDIEHVLLSLDYNSAIILKFLERN